MTDKPELQVEVEGEQEENQPKRSRRTKRQKVQRLPHGAEGHEWVLHEGKAYLVPAEVIGADYTVAESALAEASQAADFVEMLAEVVQPAVAERVQEALYKHGVFARPDMAGAQGRRALQRAINGAVHEMVLKALAQ